MPEPSDECREVTLPSGETIRVRGRGGLGPAGVAALGELVDLVRAKQSVENPPDEGAAELWARVEAALDAGPAFPLREAARRAGVKFSTLFRIAQGRMPGEADLELIEAWLAPQESPPP
jgi:hypothetical protein